MVRSVYIHIPFCQTICSYCDFCKIHYDKKYVRYYFKELKKEIQKRYRNEEIDTLYIGGGTPTSLDVVELEELLQIMMLFHVRDNLEYTIESNIECLTEEKVLLLKKYGVNRVSLGVQSFEDSILKTLSRHHTERQVFEVVSLLKKYGIENINVDLIYGVSEDKRVVWNDICTFLKLDIPHVSCYSLIIEEGTAFGIQKREYISEDIEYEMYQDICDLLEGHHYRHYEISNFSRVGYECIHNMNYWKNGEYYGFGLGAVSYLEGVRKTNTKNMSRYLKGIYEYENVIEDKKIQMENEMILGLRMLEGVSISEFNRKYQVNLFDVYDIEPLLVDGRLVIENDYLKIGHDYYYLSNDIFIQFIGEEECDV